MSRIIIIASLLFAVTPAHAAWEGKSELGFVMARGNAETETANAKLELARELTDWKHSFAIGGLYGRSNEITSAQRWDVRWQTDYRIGERQFWFGSLRYEENRYSGFSYQGSATIGMGHKFIDTAETTFTAQLGVGFRSLQPEQLIRDPFGNVVARIEQQQEGDPVSNGVVRFEHALTDSTKVLETFRVESGTSNTLLQNDLALQVKMTEVLALSVGLTARRNSNPPLTLDKTDTLSTVNLVYQLR